MDGVTPDAPTDPAARKHWMSVLAKADGNDLRKAWDDFRDKPDYRLLRAPETGLVMVRGRAGGTGEPFNFGEMTVTRCVVELDDGTTGYSYVAGTDAGHAEIAAVFDGLLQNGGPRSDIHASVIDPLHRKRLAARDEAAARTAATRVEFFTMVRGED